MHAEQPADLIPPNGIVFSGTGANRSVVITPALNKAGSSVITITVTDRGRIIGDLPGGSYFLYDAPVGDLILSWEGHNGPAGVTRSLNVTAGKIYYLEASIGFWGGITVRTLDDAEGAERIKALAQARR